jgi:flagellar hook-basal body complex protein FliE
LQFYSGTIGSTLSAGRMVRSDLDEWISKMETMRNLTPEFQARQAGVTSDVMMSAGSGNTTLRCVVAGKG